jgi:hypothetical protein
VFKNLQVMATIEENKEEGYINEPTKKEAMLMSLQADGYVDEPTKRKAM